MITAIDTTEIKSLNNKVVSSPEKWDSIRHNQDVKKISMLGISKQGKTKHEVIFKDKSSVFIFA